MEKERDGHISSCVHFPLKMRAKLQSFQMKQFLNSTLLHVVCCLIGIANLLELLVNFCQTCNRFIIRGAVISKCHGLLLRWRPAEIQRLSRLRRTVLLFFCSCLHLFSFLDFDVKKIVDGLTKHVEIDTVGLETKRHSQSNLK